MNRISLLLLILASFTCASVQLAKTSDSPASDQILMRQVRPIIREREDTIQNLFMWSLHMTRTPGGFVFSPGLDLKARFKLAPSTLGLRDVLDALVLVEPRYRWSVSDGVINLSGVGKPPLLETPIAEFKSEKATARDMIEELEEMAQVRQASASLGFNNSGGHEYDGPIGTTTSSVHCRNASLREVLNQIVRSNGRAIWTYREFTRDGKKYFSLGLLFEG